MSDGNDIQELNTLDDVIIDIDNQEELSSSQTSRTEIHTEPQEVDQTSLNNNTSRIIATMPEIISSSSQPEDSSIVKSNHVIIKGIQGAISSFTQKAVTALQEATTGPSKSVSPFQTWSKDNLLQLLIQNNVQVRGSSHATHSTLVRICDEVFGSNNTTIITFENNEQDNERTDIRHHNDEQSAFETTNSHSNHLATSTQKECIHFTKRTYTLEEISMMDVAVRKIQNKYFSWKMLKYQHNYYDNSYPGYTDHYDYAEYDYDNDYESSFHHYQQPPLQPLEQIEEAVDQHQQDSNDDYYHDGTSLSDYVDLPNQPQNNNIDQDNHEANHSISNLSHTSKSNDGITTISQNKRQSSTFHHDKRRSSTTSYLRKAKHEDLDKELEAEWRKPSWKFAKRNEMLMRPHKAGKELKKYDWRNDTLGRHCTKNGCGEQCDLWNEGQTSEFSQFGSGITNYFKFLKWCCWVMLILSIIYLPLLVLNMFGSTNQYDTSIIASTTLGNLGNAWDVDYVTIPGCDEGLYRFDNCKINKTFLAHIYSLLDAIGTVLVIIAWIWLRKFERTEVENLNRSTVTASDYTLRVTRMPPHTTEREVAVHFANLTGEAVAEVNLAFKNSKEIRMYFHRGDLMRQRFNCIQHLRHERTRGDKKAARKSMKRETQLLKERSRLTSMIEMRDEERSAKINPSQEVIEAFVTFDREEGFIKAMSAYQLSWIRSICCFYPRELRFKGMKLKVHQAPEPSMIIWENLEISQRSRFFRKCLTTFVASLAILLSIAFTFLAREFKIETMRNVSQSCPDHFFDLPVEKQIELMTQDATLSHCYCSSLSIENQLQSDLCIDYVKTNIKSSLMNYGAGFMVCFMNIFFTWLMDRAGTFEKHESLDAMESSNMTRVFVLKFLNTGCLVLLYTVKWLQMIVRVRFEDPINFNVDWYGTGGVSIVIVMTINIISPHLGSLMQYRSHQKKIRKLEKGLTEDKETDDQIKIWYTQEELNAVYLGPPFRLNHRYTQLLVNFFICWMYAISMPILPLIGAISFYVSYWVDKFLFCNFYRIPPKYSDKIGRKSTNLIAYGIFLHIFMSCWILGNHQIFTGKSAFDYEQHILKQNVHFKYIITNENIVILEVIALLFVGTFILKYVFASCGFTVMKLWRCLICSKGNVIKKLHSNMNTVQINYSNARARGVIKGLASYNILQNPKYQEAFAISPEFANYHHRLSSIRGYNTKEGDLNISERSSSINDDSAVSDNEFEEV